MTGTQRFRALVALGVVLTVVTLGFGGLAGGVPDCATGSVVELELARTEAKATELIGECDADGLQELLDGLRADDLGFAPLYVITVAFWCLLAERSLRWSGSRRRGVVLAAAVAIAVAGAFDLVENHFLREVVEAGGASDAAGPATYASYVKWVLVLFAVPVSVVAMARSVQAAVRPERLATADPA